MPELPKSRAHANSFFEWSGPGVAHDRTRVLVRNWFPVTHAFCLSLPGYTALLAREVLKSSGKHKQALEKALLVPMSICAGEFGMGSRGVDGMHYRMFARLGEPLR